MKIEVISNKPNEMQFIIKDSDPSMANALRRIILGEVPTMAITELSMYENSSALFDEYIAHRVGLIPLTSDLKTYKLPVDCCGGNCNTCSIEFSLDEGGPKMVYSSDLKTNDVKIKPVSGKIPIIELREGQRLRFEAKAVLGSGEQHAKWQVGNAAYKYMPEIKIFSKLENPKEVVNASTSGALQLVDGKATVVDIIAATDPEMYEETAQPPGAVQLNHKNDEFLFKIETNGQMRADEALRVAIGILQNKSKELTIKIAK